MATRMTGALFVALCVFVNEAYAGPRPRSVVENSTSAASAPLSVALGGKTYVNKVRAPQPLYKLD